MGPKTEEDLRRYLRMAEEDDLLLVSRDDLEALLARLDILTLAASDWSRNTQECPECHLNYALEPCGLRHSLVRRLLRKLRK